jgi:hypothetical protein
MYRLSLLLSLIVLWACTKEVVKKESEIVAPEFTQTAYIIKETVNLRRSNSTRSGIIKKLSDGQPVRIIRNLNGWYEIYDNEGARGWVRTDMAGPSNLSRTRLARAFVDSVLPAYNAEMYFDKTDLYQTIYLILPASYYNSKDKAENYARNIARNYQKSVYPGNIEIRVMQKNRQDLFIRFQLQAIDNPDTPVPIINEGILISLKQNDWQIEANVAVPLDMTHAKLLEQARSISSTYKLPYIKVEVFQAVNNESGRAYLQNHDNKPADPALCRLYYLEDKDGEYYKYDYCK